MIDFLVFIVQWTLIGVIVAELWALGVIRGEKDGS